MNGAQSLVRTLADCGIELCLANPGTSEMHVVAALDNEPRIRGVLCLFEGVAAGAADGYARMTAKPAMTLLHLGPGFANAVSHLHNARKGGQPIVNIVGDHATSHAQYEQAPLSSDILGICRPVSDWLHQSRHADDVAGDGARAVAAAQRGQIATLVLPADCAWGEAAGPAASLPGPITRPVDTARIEAVAAALKNGKRSMLILRGRCLEAAGMMAAGRIAAKTGARIAHEYFTPRITRGAGLPHIERIPYFGEEIAERLSGLEQIILVGAPPPVTFFVYPGRTGWVTPDGCALITLAQAQDDGAAALAALADVLDAHQDAPPVTLIRPAMPAPGALTSAAMGAIMARLMPDDCILSDDSLTAGPGIQAALKTGPRHDALFLTGGAIGDALPMAVGAALACPPRKVIAATGDGAAMYSLPALWTMARERLDVTVIVCANRSYNILNIELARVGALAAGNAQPGPRTLSMLDLRDPVIDFVKQAEGMGVAAGRAETTQDFAAQFAEAMSRPGPRLIEAVLQT